MIEMKITHNNGYLMLEFYVTLLKGVFPFHLFQNDYYEIVPVSVGIQFAIFFLPMNVVVFFFNCLLVLVLVWLKNEMP